MKIRTKINIGFLATFVLISSLIGLVVGIYTTNLVKNNIYSYLNLSSRSRAEHIRTFLQGQKDSTKILAGTLSVEEYLTQKNTNAEYLNGAELLAECFEKIIENNPSIYEIFMLNADGEIVVTTDRSHLGEDKSNDTYFIGGKNDTYIKDIYYSELTGKINYTISSPIRDDKTGNLLGVMVVRYDPKDFFTLVKTENGLGKTEENFLVNKDKFFITPSLFLGDSVILKQKVETKNVNICFDPAEIDYVNKNGYSNLEKTIGHNIVEAKDYRNLDVIATHAYIPETGWCLVTKIDKSDAMSFRTILILIFLSIFISGGLIYLLIGYLISKKITDPMKDLTVGTQKVEQGDFDYVTNIKTEDEIGALSRSFDKMVATVKTSRAEIETKVAEQTGVILEKSKDMENQQVAILNILEDVEVEKDKAALERDKMNIILQSIGDGVFVLDTKLNIIVANPKSAEINGISSVNDILGKNYYKVFHFTDETKTDEVRDAFILKALKDGVTTEMANHTVLIRTDGTKIPVSDSCAPLKDREGKITGCVVVFRDITKERNIDRMKSEFVSLSSHQLRTPLTAVKWGLETVLNGGAGELTTKQKEYLTDVNNSNEREIELVNSLLNVSRIESGRIIITPQPTNIVKLANDVIGRLKVQLTKKDISVVINAADGIPEIDLDQGLVSNVYQNLLTNAIYYSPSGSKITLSISTDGREITSSVKDEGIGIPEDEKSKVFNRFYRASNAIKERPDGNGLGLYIVKSIVESSGGRVWFESTTGKGTTFYFSLPLTGMKAKAGEVSLS